MLGVYSWHTRLPSPRLAALLSAGRAGMPPRWPPAAHDPSSKAVVMLLSAVLPTCHSCRWHGRVG